MSNKYARVARRAAKKEMERFESKNEEVVKTFLGAVSGWPLKSRLSMAWKIIAGKYKKWGLAPS